MGKWRWQSGERFALIRAEHACEENTEPCVGVFLENDDVVCPNCSAIFSQEYYEMTVREHIRKRIRYIKTHPEEMSRFERLLEL